METSSPQLFRALKLNLEYGDRKRKNKKKPYKK